MIRSLQALDRREQLARFTGHGGRYEDAVQYGDYKIESIQDDNDLRLILWNPEKPCIVAVIDKHEHVAVIDDIEYSTTCTRDGRMQKGQGTRKMIQFMLDYLSQHGADTVELSDKSTVMCNGVKVRLGLMYFFKFGETWYEHFFGFKPSEKYRANYETIKQKRYILGDVSNKPCDYFTDDVIDDLVNKLGFGFFYNVSWVKQLP